MLSTTQFNDMSSSTLSFVTSSRETLINKCVLNTEMRIAIYLKMLKNIPVAAGLEVSLVP